MQGNQTQQGGRVIRNQDESFVDESFVEEYKSSSPPACTVDRMVAKFLFRNQMFVKAELIENIQIN